MDIPVVTSGGARIPVIGLGTWDLRGRTCARAVEQALRMGYRHIDTAEMYGNEHEVGEGLRASGIRRDDVFITTKVWPDETGWFRPAYRNLELHRAAGRGGDAACDRAARHQPDRMASLSRSIQSR